MRLSVWICVFVMRGKISSANRTDRWADTDFQEAPKRRSFPFPFPLYGMQSLQGSRTSWHAMVMTASPAVLSIAPCIIACMKNWNNAIFIFREPILPLQGTTQPIRLLRNIIGRIKALFSLHKTEKRAILKRLSSIELFFDNNNRIPIMECKFRLFDIHWDYTRCERIFRQRKTIRT